MERSVVPQNQSESPKVDPFQSSASLGFVNWYGKDASLHGSRKKLSMVVNSELSDLFLIFIVALNFILVLYGAELFAAGIESKLIANAGFAFLIFYVLEITVRIYIDRLSYFKRKSNLLDFGVVLADVVAETLIVVGGKRNPSLGLLRLFRIMKLTRVFQRVTLFRELWLMLHGLASTIRAMAWACFLILLVLLVCSLVSAELLNPLQTRLYADGGFEDCTSCANAFQGIIRSLFTWFLLIFCGEMWVDLVKPLVEAEPYTALIFASAYLLINIGLMNLVLTVIVDRAAAARVDDEGFKLQQKKDEWEKASQKLCRWCANIDADKSGTVSLEELETGAESNSDFKGALAAMDLGSEDLKTVFSILDEDNSGTVTYKEFVSQLYKIKTQDSHTLLVIIKHYLQDVRRSVQQQLVMLKTEMSERVDDKTASANKFVRLTVPATEVSVQSSPHSSAVSRLSNGLSCVDSRCVVDQECLESTSSAVLSVPQDRIENNLSRALMAAGSDDTMVQATNLSESAKPTTLEALTEAVEPSEISESMKVSVCSELRRLSGLTEQVVACLRRDSVEV